MTNVPLRVGIFVMKFPQVSETFIVTKVLKMIEAGFDVHIFAAAESSHWDSFEVLRGREDVSGRVHVLPRADRKLGSLASGAMKIARIAARHPQEFFRYVTHTWSTRNETAHGFVRALYLRAPFIEHPLDILHIEFDAQGVGIADLKKFLRCRVLLSSRGTFQQLSTLDTTPDACEYLFRYADGYHFISKFLEENTLGLGLPPDVPSWLIEPAIDLALFKPAARNDRNGPLRIISVGRLSWEKGYEFGLEALSLARKAGMIFEYTIYGSGPYEEPIRYAVQQLGLADCVQLAGSVRREEMPAAYGRADLMIHSALAEGFCNAVIEAQAMEIPVIATDAGGLPENIEDGTTGYIVPRRDARAMSEKIMLLANDRSLRTRLGEAGRQRAVARFDLDQQAHAFVQLYRELADAPQRRVA